MVNMSDYTPPFSISNKMLGFVSSISEKIGKISNYNDFESKPQLRKNNRIKYCQVRYICLLKIHNCNRY